MSRMNRALVLLTAFGLWSTGLTAQPLETQTSNKEAVTVKATPLKVNGPVWEFELVFDTHSQDLSDDLLMSSVLVAPDGTQVKPVAWNGDAPSGHHRKGLLRFNALNPSPDVLELRITRPKETVPRTFKWTLPQK